MKQNCQTNINQLSQYGHPLSSILEAILACPRAGQVMLRDKVDTANGDMRAEVHIGQGVRNMTVKIMLGKAHDRKMRVLDISAHQGANGLQLAAQITVALENLKVPVTQNGWKANKMKEAVEHARQSVTVNEREAVAA